MAGLEPQWWGGSDDVVTPLETPAAADGAAAPSLDIVRPHVRCSTSFAAAIFNVSRKTGTVSFLSVQCNAMQCIGQNIKSRKRPSVHPSGVCGQDCDVIYGPIFTTFGT